MLQEKALRFVKQIQQLSDNYAENFNKEIPGAKDYSPEYIKEQTKKNNNILSQEIVKKVESIKADINQLNSEMETKKREILYPLLSKNSSETINVLGEQHMINLLGEQQITNSLLMFQISYPNGNPDFVINQIKEGISDPRRRCFISSLLEQVVNFPNQEGIYEKPFNEALMIKTQFEDQNGVTEINKSKKITLYAEKMADVTLSLVKENLGGFYIPAYSEQFDFDDKMQLVNLSTSSGIDLKDFSS